MLSLWIGLKAGPIPANRSLYLLGTDPPMDYPFIGTNVAEQQESIELLAQAMQGGQGTLVTEITSIVDIDIENFPGGAAQFVDVMFKGANELVMDAEVLIEDLEPGQSLLDVLEQAAEALLAALE